jgi:hypothetical protein
MAIPTPEPGLVISYAYPWHHEHLAGQEEGWKDRPAVIVVAARRERDDATEVTVLPVTHRPPDNPDWAVEIPAPVNAISASMLRVHGSSSLRATNLSGLDTISEKFRTPTATTMASCRRGFSISCSARSTNYAARQPAV